MVCHARAWWLVVSARTRLDVLLEARCGTEPHPGAGCCEGVPNVQIHAERRIDRTVFRLLECLVLEQPGGRPEIVQRMFAGIVDRESESESASIGCDRRLPVSREATRTASARDLPSTSSSPGNARDVEIRCSARSASWRSPWLSVRGMRHLTHAAPGPTRCTAGTANLKPARSESVAGWLRLVVALRHETVYCRFGAELAEPEETVLAQGFGESRGQAVERHPTGPSPVYEAGCAQHPEAITGGVLGDSESQGEVAHAELLGCVEREQQTHPGRVGDQREDARHAFACVRAGEPVAGAGDGLGVDGVGVVSHGDPL